jgi:hypothetical protein
MSDVEQGIDSLQVRRGNPNLKPYMNYQTNFTGEWQHKIWYVNLQGIYQIAPHEIMEESFWDNNENVIVQTTANQKRWQMARAESNIRIGPFLKKIVEIDATIGYDHYISNGKNYYHTYDWLWGEIGIEFNYKNFMLGCDWHRNPHTFTGETMLGSDDNLMELELGYRYKNWQVAIAAMQPFVNSYHVDSRNYSAIASYNRKMYSNDLTHLFLFQIAYNVNFGHRYHNGQKLLHNADNDSGVMNVGK